VNLVGFIIRVYHDALSTERQIQSLSFSERCMVRPALSLRPCGQSPGNGPVTTLDVLWVVGRPKCT